MTLAASPLVRSLATVLGLAFVATAGVPGLESVSPFLVPLGSAILGALHVNLPTK